MLNKFKEFYKNTYGMLITLSWILLIVCLIIKLFGGNWFELNSENSKFIDFCNYVDNNLWLKMILACIIYLISGYFILSCILNKKLDKKLILIFFPLMMLKSILNWYLSIIPFVLDLFILIGLTTIINKNIKRSVLSYLFILLLQILTLLTRNLSFGLSEFNFNNTFVEQFLFQIDYYIMIILWYLYTFKRKEIKQ